MTMQAKHPLIGSAEELHAAVLSKVDRLPWRRMEGRWWQGLLLRKYRCYLNYRTLGEVEEQVMVELRVIPFYAVLEVSCNGEILSSRSVPPRTVEDLILQHIYWEHRQCRERNAKINRETIKALVRSIGEEHDDHTV